MIKACSSLGWEWGIILERGTTHIPFWGIDWSSQFFASFPHNISYQSAPDFHADSGRGEPPPIRKNTSIKQTLLFLFFSLSSAYLFITASAFGKAHCGCRDEGEFRSKLPWGLIPSILSFCLFSCLKPTVDRSDTSMTCRKRERNGRKHKVSLSRFLLIGTESLVLHLLGVKIYI